jgi:TonB family protein
MASRAPVAPANQQSRLVIALVLLLLALAAVLIKDRQFWFGSESIIIDANDYQPATAPQTAPQTPIQPATETPAKTMAPAVMHAPATTAKKHLPATSTPTQSKPAEAPAVVTNRTVLPPLDVEVIAGDKHRNLRPGNKAQTVQILKPAAPAVRQAPPVAAPATNAAQRERLAEAIPPSYPALAQHMNVQGAVVLQALIAADGTIQNLRVMSGPAILSNAAQQAVREWRFKPVYQNGQAVETRATITVNFTIRVGDSSANTTLAENSDLTTTQ